MMLPQGCVAPGFFSPNSAEFVLESTLLVSHHTLGDKQKPKVHTNFFQRESSADRETDRCLLSHRLTEEFLRTPSRLGLPDHEPSDINYFLGHSYPFALRDIERIIVFPARKHHSGIRERLNLVLG